MPSLFKSKQKKKEQSSNQPVPGKPLATSKSLPSLAHSTLASVPIQPPSLPIVHIDDFGRPLPNPPPAFTLANQRYKSRRTLRRDSSETQNEKELQLLYGYTGLYTDVDLDLSTTAQAIDMVTQQIKSRALDTPLLFSTQALDISIEGTHSLIRSFVNDQHDFQRDLQISSPHNLSAFLKWVLGRHVNAQGLHGFLRWDKYASWRESERASDYPARFITTHLLSLLPSTIAGLLSCLLDLFSKVSAYSHLNGMTAHKCGAIFGAFIFGLEDDMPFEKTYTSWLRYSHATEHLILAYIRDQKAISTTGQLASRMEAAIKGYPNVIPSLVKTHPSARLEKVARFKRFARFYNKNLILNASTWEVGPNKTWDRLKPYPSTVATQSSNNSKAGLTNTATKPVFTKLYKHLLNIGSYVDPDDEEVAECETDFETQQRFKSLVEKEWSGFMNKGFLEPDRKKLEFDLTESERLKRRQKHDTMDWDSFAGSGFLGRETYMPTDLQFNTDFSKTVATWPNEKKMLSKKLTKTNKALPAFPYDITPVEQEPLFVDENFFEAWADALVSSGWSRDEFKDVSWVLINYKCKPANHLDVEFQPTSTNQDGRTDDIWILFVEVVPPEYREELIESGHKIHNALTKRSKRISFLRSMTRRDYKKNTSTPAKMAPIREAVSIEYYPSAPQRQPTQLLLSYPNVPYGQTKRLNLTPELSSSWSDCAASSVVPLVGHDDPDADGLPREGPQDSHHKGSKDITKSKTKGAPGIYDYPHTFAPVMTARSADFQCFEHDTQSVLDDLSPTLLANTRGNKAREPWVNVLTASPQPNPNLVHTNPNTTIEDISGEALGGSCSTSSDETQNFDRPMNPSPPSSSRVLTPNTDSGGPSLEGGDDAANLHLKRSNPGQTSRQISDGPGSPSSPGRPPPAQSNRRSPPPTSKASQRAKSPLPVHQVLIPSRTDSLTNVRADLPASPRIAHRQEFHSPSNAPQTVLLSASLKKVGLDRVEKSKAEVGKFKPLEIKPFDPKTRKVSNIVDLFEKSDPVNRLQGERAKSPITRLPKPTKS